MKVSVIIPYYNREETLQRCLLSVYQQTYRPIELILVDNQSTDHSTQICQDFTNTYNSTDFSIILTQCSSQGACFARNKGLERASSEYLYFFDSDDEMSETFLSDVFTRIKNTNTDLCIASTRMKTKEGGLKTRKGKYLISIDAQIYTCFLSTQAYVVKKELLQKVGKWNEKAKVWNDWELGIRLLLAHPKIVWLNKDYHTIYLHDKSITGNGFSKNLPHLLLTAKEAKKSIQQSNLTFYEKRKYLGALTLKMVLLKAKLAKENEQNFKDLNHFIASCSPSKYTTFLGKIIYNYEILGGKGGWFIAYYLQRFILF